MQKDFQTMSKILLSEEREPDEERVGLFSFPVSKASLQALLLCSAPKLGGTKTVTCGEGSSFMLPL